MVYKKNYFLDVEIQFILNKKNFLIFETKYFIKKFFIIAILYKTSLFNQNILYKII